MYINILEYNINYPKNNLQILIHEERRKIKQIKIIANIKIKMTENEEE